MGWQYAGVSISERVKAPVYFMKTIFVDGIYFFFAAVVWRSIIFLISGYKKKTQPKRLRCHIWQEDGIRDMPAAVWHSGSCGSSAMPVHGSDGRVRASVRVWTGQLARKVSNKLRKYAKI